MGDRAVARSADVRGQVIDAGDDVTVVQVLEETLGLAPAPCTSP